MKLCEAKNIRQWKKPIIKILRILCEIETTKSSQDSIHISDVELILNGLEFYPTKDQLEDFNFEIRFRSSHLTWEVHESINIDEFCNVMANHSKWLLTEKFVKSYNTNLNTESDQSKFEAQSPDVKSPISETKSSLCKSKSKISKTVSFESKSVEEFVSESVSEEDAKTSEEKCSESETKLSESEAKFSESETKFSESETKFSESEIEEEEDTYQSSKVISPSKSIDELSITE